MDIRLKALLKTALHIILIFVASTFIIYFSHGLTAEDMLDIFLLALVSIGSWMMYKANLIDCKQEEIEAKKTEDERR
jgi:nicotinamide riboside transporter PnuC